MSIFSALDTAVSGLSAQAAAFSNISDNVSNSQTVGFKETDTAFQDYLTTSTALTNVSGATVALPEYQNSIQGNITQSQDPLSLAISGQGFFPISIPEVGATAGPNGTPVFSPEPAYTRAGDFTMNAQGYLVNSAGNYLNGWQYTSGGTIDTTKLLPIQVSQSTESPVATTEVTLAANLPATPASTGSSAPPYTSQVTVYDSLGVSHQIDLVWNQTLDSNNNPVTGSWTVSVVSPDDTTSSAIGSAVVTFGTGASGSTSSGTIDTITQTTPPPNTVTVTPSANTVGGAATLTFSTTFPGTAAQTLTVNLGTFGGTTGLTQFAGTNYTQNSLTQDGTAPGLFSSVSTASSGDILINYSNGQSRAIARVPIVTFNDPDALQRLNGQAFTTTTSNTPSVQQAGTEGAGTIDTTSVENSNVDIASEFSALIVAQQAYSANTKVVSTANQMLQQALDMKQ